MINKETIKPEEIIQLLEAPTNDRRPLKQLLKRDAALKVLIEALKISTTPLTRRILCDILGDRRAKSAIPVLISCLDDPDWKVRNDATEALASIKSPKAGEALLSHLIDDPLPAYAGALGAVGYNPAIPFLIEALKSSSPNIRGAAAWSLGELRATEGVSALEKALLKENNEYSSNRICEALKRLKEGV